MEDHEYNVPSKDAGKYENILDTRHLHTDLKMRAVKGAGFTITASTLGYGIQTIGTIILARLLSPEDFGMVAMVSTFSLLVQNFGLWGFVEAVVQRENISHDEMSKLFWTNLFIMLSLTLVFMASTPIITAFYREPQLKYITIAMSLSIIFGGLTTCHTALLFRGMKFHLTSIINVITGIISTVIAIVAATRGFGYWSLVLRRVSIPLLTAILVWLLCAWRPGIPKRNTDIKPLLKFGLNTYGNYLVDYFRKNADKVMVGKFFGKTPLGHYDRATQLSSVLPNQLTATLSGVGVATLSRLKNDRTRFLDYYAKALSILSFIAFPGSVLFTLVGKDIISVLLGPHWDRAGEIFTALGPAIGVVVIYDANIWLHLSLGRPDRLIKWGTFALVASLVSFLAGTIFGPLGVAVAYSALFYVLLFPALYYAGRPLNIKMSYFISVLWKYWFAAFISGAVYFALFKIIKPSAFYFEQLAPLARIGLSAFLYLLIYLIFIFVLFQGFRPITLLASTLRDIVRR